MDDAAGASARYERLKDYLSADSDNLRLIAEAADAAWLAGEPAEATALIERHAAVAPPPPSLINLLGLCALADDRFADAASIFSSLLADRPADPGLRFNLAWARSRLNDHAGVLEALAQATENSQAAALQVRSLHHLGRLEEALVVGDAWEGRSDDPDLWSALATAALDHEDLERAARWAGRADTTAEGQAAIGMLAMAEGRSAQAREHFEQALALRSDLARGHLGMGAVLLSGDMPTDAARRFDQAAETFGDHLGSWIAAGWAWLIAGDAEMARERFERVIALDDTFSEAHGGLALLDFQEGRPDDARRRAEIALRLDRHSLGGTLVSSLLLEQAGKAEAAAAIVQRALTAPIGPGGQSIAEVLATRAAMGRIAP
ncbi:tetratricopeptide repeat protein [Brevundimonas sp.]|uniref:tetratricopeptide repeat protein n=1 Tax=Brevundimonas sp. TaxID=1871086 RepID=UPI002D6A0E2E|nr:tetratricopeptide repeat protein [Brevundimonas sp.]HYC68887.1 tetratricopeptide repeat protein [Brevundimonas sp.]